MNRLTVKLNETIRSILPIVVFVLFLHFTITPIESTILIQFLIGAAFVILGLTIFLVGVDIAITPIGEYLGRGMVLSGKSWVVLIGGFILGFIIAFAEPSLVVLADQISSVTSGSIPASLILTTVSGGVGLMVGLGALRILKDWSLRKILILSYGLIFLAMLFTSNQFISIAFDASAAVTGAIAVPFIMAIATGIANMKKDNAEADSFGLVGLLSVGAVLAVMLLSILTGQSDISGSVEIATEGADNISAFFLSALGLQFQEVILSVLPVAIIFGLYQLFSLKLRSQALRPIMFGLLYVYIGLVIYLAGINAGFMNVGAIIGYALASMGNYWPLLIASFVLGAVTILAEPAVTVQTQMIEDVTGGSIKSGPITATFSVGVGLAIFLAALRIIVPAIELWHIVVPGYILALILINMVPDMFVGMSFDSGSVASGPMSATFILAYVQGIAQAVPTADVLRDGFGMIALVAMVPIIAVLIFAFVYSRQAEREDSD